MKVSYSSVARTCIGLWKHDLGILFAISSTAIFITCNGCNLQDA
jgi:hypothetical protein